MHSLQSSQQKGSNSTFPHATQTYAQQTPTPYSIGASSTPAAPYNGYPSSSAQPAQNQTYSDFAYRTQYQPESPKFTLGEDGIPRNAWSQQDQQEDREQKNFLPNFLTAVSSGRGTGSDIGSPRREPENPFARTITYNPSLSTFGGASHYGQTDGIIARSEPIPTPASSSAQAKKDPPPIASLYDITDITEWPDDRTLPHGEQNGFMPLDYGKGDTKDRTAYQGAEPRPATTSTGIRFDASSSLTQGQANMVSSNATPTTITVFGFPPELTSQLLTQFATHGRLVSYQASPEGGNWMDITYPDRWSAQKALAWNGKIISGRWMVGVALQGADVGDSGNGRGLTEVARDEATPTRRSVPSMPSRADSTFTTRSETSFFGAYPSRSGSSLGGPQRIHIDNTGDVFRRAPGVGMEPSKVGGGFVGAGLESSSTTASGLWGKAMDVIFGW